MLLTQHQKRNWVWELVIMLLFGRFYLLFRLIFIYIFLKFCFLPFIVLTLPGKFVLCQKGWMCMNNFWKKMSRCNRILTSFYTLYWLCFRCFFKCSDIFQCLTPLWNKLLENNFFVVIRIFLFALYCDMIWCINVFRIILSFGFSWTFSLFSNITLSTEFCTILCWIILRIQAP